MIMRTTYTVVDFVLRIYNSRQALKLPQEASQYSQSWELAFRLSQLLASIVSIVYSL